MKLLILFTVVLAALTARAATANLIYDTTARVVLPTNLFLKNQIITNRLIDGVSSSAIATNSAANKLAATNGTAVNLTFSQTPEAAAGSFLSADTTTLNVLGNSIPAGGTVSALSLAYGSLTATDLGLTQNLLANPSFNLCDVNWSSFAGWTVTNTVGVSYIGTTPTNIDESTIVLLDNSYNDVRGGETATQFADGLRHLICWWTIPHSAKRMAQTAAPAGTWTNLTWLGAGDIGSVGTTDSATLTFTNVIGSDIVVSYLGWATNFGATITVTIDGAAQDPINTASKAYGNREYVNGSDSNIPDRVGPYGNGKLDFCPQSVRYTGLGMSGHTVVITTSTTSNGGAYVLWVAGNGWTREAKTGPYAIMPSTPSQGTWTAGGSDARQASFNLQIAAEIRAAQASGLRVLYAPLSEAIIPATYVNDGVHWSNAGHRAAADAMLTPFYLDLPYAGALRVESSGSSGGGIGSFTSLTVTGTSDLNTLDTSGAATIGGNLTGEGRLLMLPTASVGGTAHRFGYGSTTNSSVEIYGSSTTLDKVLAIGGDYIVPRKNSDNTAADMRIGASGANVAVSGTLSVVSNTTIAGTLSAGATTINGDGIINGTGTVNGRLLALPAASSGGTPHRLGYGSVTNSSIILYSSDSSLDRLLTLTGNSITSTINSVGGAANLTIGSVGALVSIPSALSVGDTLDGVSGTEVAAGITYTVNQASGTGSSRGLNIAATTTALGSGTHRLINASDDGVDRFYLQTDGRLIVYSPNGTFPATFRGDAETNSRITLTYAQTLDRSMNITGNQIYVRDASGVTANNLSIAELASTTTIKGPVIMDSTATVTGVTTLAGGVSHSSYLRSPYTAVTTDTTLTDATTTANINDSAGNVTVTLPSAVGRAGQHYWLKKSNTSTNTVTLTAANAGTDYILDDLEAVVVESNDSVWHIKAGWSGASGISGSTGSTDNSLLRADGTGGSTLQASAVIIDDYTAATAPNVALKVDDGSTANIAAVITPKGTGAFIVGAKPDGTSTGGAARGSRAVDLQLYRTTAAQVASGANAMVWGSENTASGAGSTAGGLNSTASGGSSSTALGYYVTSSGGYGSLATGYGSVASGFASVSSGDGAISDKRGQWSISGGRPSGTGQNQTSIATVLNSTASTTPTVLFLDGSSARLTVPNDAFWTFTIMVSGTTATATAQRYAYKLEGCIGKGTTSASTSMPVAVTQTVIYEHDAGADVTATADTTNGSLSITVTAANATATRWSASVIWNQIGYP